MVPGHAEWTVDAAMKDLLTKGQMVGFDTESFANDLSGKAGNIQILQFATKKRVFIFDAARLKQDQSFKKFLVSFWKDPAITKIGHTLRGDGLEMSRS